MRAWASKAVPLKEMADNYLDGTSLVYLEEMHADWREGKPVDPGMEAVFRGLDSGKLGETMAAAVTAQLARWVSAKCTHHLDIIIRMLTRTLTVSR